MTNSNGWGGKRDGAGPKQKYSAAFILEIGSLCQARLLAARDKAKAKAKDDLTGQLSDLRDHWQKAHQIEQPERQQWLKSDQGKQYIEDVDFEVSELNRTLKTGSETNRLFNLNVKTPHRARKTIRCKVAAEYSLTENQVKYLWAKYTKIWEN
jgi:hypothetical protein